ncbi:MAG TPA: hypothetical protein VJ673_09485 [Aromatoleum sp.]|uniref:hypothetical protein n=1 Tax=Aromatoleum sp. TaxID=2307007 RepID=UPI002B47C2DA|nr:hypothetical protein [Aromatoleum sp.]HJV25910.1 hypothetical protein [Aromatoleum sp.]
MDYEKLRLGMVLRDRNAHYRLRDIQRRRFTGAVSQCGLGPGREAIIDDVVSRLPEMAGNPP